MYENAAQTSGVSRPGGRKVGRKPTFSRREAIAAAFAEGVDSFTLAGVAKRLGVATPAIYRLFPSREDLVRACIEEAGSTIQLPELDDPWRDVLQMWANECWRLSEEYPGISRLVFAMPTAPVQVESVITTYVESIVNNGKTPRQAVFALDFIGDTVFASHLGVETMRHKNVDGETGLDAMRKALEASESSLTAEDSWASRSILDSKVEFILRGLEYVWPEF